MPVAIQANYRSHRLYLDHSLRRRGQAQQFIPVKYNLPSQDLFLKAQKFHTRTFNISLEE